MFQMNPEFRSITAICVVEDVSKCPLGYTPIVRTHDTDQDADLWKDGFFGRRITRYVCVSKSQGKPEHVVNSVQILHDRELPPEGYSLVQQTVDSYQKPFKKKQLAYKLVHYRSNVDSMIEMILLSKFKEPLPDGFEHIGDINGMHFCMRKVSAVTRLNSPSLSYGILPGGGPGSMYPNLQQSLNDLHFNKRNSSSSIINETRPFGSVPNSPAYSTGATQFALNRQQSTTTTLSQLSGVEGVPFALNEALKPAVSVLSPIQKKPVIAIKNETEIENEYKYDFRTEHELMAESVVW